MIVPKMDFFYRASQDLNLIQSPEDALDYLDAARVLKISLPDTTMGVLNSYISELAPPGYRMVAEDYGQSFRLIVIRNGTDYPIAGGDNIPF